MDFLTFALLLALFSTVPATDIYLPSLPGMAEHFGVAASAIKDSIVAYQIGSLLAALILGFLSDRFGRKPIIVFGLCLFFIGSLLCAFTDSFYVFITGRIFEGAGAVSLPIVGWAMIHDLYTKEQSAKIMSILGAAYAILPLISPTLGGYIDISFGWHWNFKLLSILSACTTILIFFKLENVKTPTNSLSLSPQSYLQNCLKVFKNRTFLSYVSIFAILLCGEWCYLTLIPFYLENTMQFGPTACGFYISLVGISYILGSLATPPLINALGFEKSIGAGTLVSTLGAGLLFLTACYNTNYYVLNGIGIALYLFGIAVVWAPSTSKSLESFTDEKGTASSIRSLIFTLLSALGSFIASLMGGGSLYFLAQFLCLCALIAFIIFRIQQSREKFNSKEFL